MRVAPERQRHAVRARLGDGWALQPCATLPLAAALFDRLRTLNPALPIERIQNGRVVETTKEPQA